MNEINIGGLVNWKVFYNDSLNLLSVYKLMKPRIYDCLGNHISNGGMTIQAGYMPELDSAQEDLIARVSADGINFDQIMTNYYLCSIDNRLDNRLKYLSKFGQNGVTVSSLDIAKMVKASYPNLLIRWSITAVYRDNPQDLIKYCTFILRHVDRIVLPVEYNNDPIIDQLDPSKIELMIYDHCGICKNRKMHYTLSSADQVRLVKGEISNIGLNNHFCQKISKTIHDPTFILPRQLLNLSKRGFNKFKIASRNFGYQDLRSYMELVMDGLVGHPYNLPLSPYEKRERKRLISDMKDLTVIDPSYQ